MDPIKHPDDAGRKQSFLELLLTSSVLKFGDFLTKSGRRSPYFFNTGNLSSGRRIEKASHLYAQIIAREFPQVTTLYGPAYKGIPLCVAVSQALATLLGRDISYTFNRKEAKGHGEGGGLVGHQFLPGDKILIVEDVLTGGTSLRESLTLLRSMNAPVIGAVVGIDREERGGTSKKSARSEIQDDFGIPVTALITLSEIIGMLSHAEILGKIWLDADTLGRIKAYRREFGVV